MANKSWIDWRFQIHWSKIEWVNPRSCNGGKNPFFVSSKKFCVNYNIKNGHWVGHLKVNPLNLEDFYYRKRIINGIEASLTGASIKQSDYLIQNNPVL